MCGSLVAVLPSTAVIRRLPGEGDAWGGRAFKWRVVPTESEVVAAFLRRCRRTISVDDADVEVFFLVKLRHRPQKMASSIHERLKAR